MSDSSTAGEIIEIVRSRDRHGEAIEESDVAEKAGMEFDDRFGVGRPF